MGGSYPALKTCACPFPLLAPHPKVYHSLKEAISGLSPVIRNRLRGLPAYVLDYSDLISPNRWVAK